MISLLVPSRGRPSQLTEMWNTARETAVGDIELIYRLDEDDQSTYERLPYAYQIIGPRVVLSQCWNECAKYATNLIMMHCGDDIRFRTEGWDALIADAFEQYEDRIVLVHGNDGIHGGNLATHGFLHRNWVDAVGYFVPPLFSSDYNDTWLTDVADMIGRRHYLQSVYTEHLHPVAGKGEWDQTHLERLERHRADNVDALYAQTLDRRHADADKLRKVMQ